MRANCVILCAFVIATSIGNAQPVDAVRFRAWESITGRTETPMRVSWNDDRTAVTGIVLEGMTPAEALTEAEAITDAQVAEWQAAQDAEQANAAAMPATFPTGIAVPIPDADGHYMLLQPSGDGLPVVAIQISDSPIDPQTWRARRDAKLSAIEADRVTRAQDYAAKQTKAKQTAQGAQNVPQLRAAMADMQAQIDALRAIVEAGR